MADDPLLGDIVAKRLQQLHIDKLANALTKVTKKPCGCEKRKDALNDLHRRLKEKRK